MSYDSSASSPEAQPERWLGPLEEADLVLAEHDAGRPVGIAVLLGGEGVPAPPGSRLLVLSSGEVRGGFGVEALDRSAAERARAALSGDAPGVHESVAGEATARFFVEAHSPPETLVVVGAGHIAVPLARIGDVLGFRVVVLDDREEFTSPARFPFAEVRRADFADAFAGVPLGPGTFVVLVTRGHRYDFDCLSQLLRRGETPAYVGMIGSRRRVRAAFHALLEGGVPRERLAGVRAPVGLEIGAETPEEIALSIMAEVVAVRRGAPTAGAIGERERVLDRFLSEPAPDRDEPDSGQPQPGEEDRAAAPVGDRGAGGPDPSPETSTDG